LDAIFVAFAFAVHAATDGAAIGVGHEAVGAVHVTQHIFAVGFVTGTEAAQGQVKSAAVAAVLGAQGDEIESRGGQTQIFDQGIELLPTHQIQGDVLAPQTGRFHRSV